MFMLSSSRRWCGGVILLCQCCSIELATVTWRDAYHTVIVPLQSEIELMGESVDLQLPLPGDVQEYTMKIDG